MTEARTLLWPWVIAFAILLLMGSTGFALSETGPDRSTMGYALYKMILLVAVGAVYIWVKMR